MTKTTMILVAIMVLSMGALIDPMLDEPLPEPIPQPGAVLVDGGNVDTVDVVRLVERSMNVQSMFVGATDYEVNDTAKTFVLISIDGQPVNNASCFMQSFYPNNTKFMAYTSMNFLEEGLYYHDFIIPNVTGVYPVQVKCTYITGKESHVASAGSRLLGAGAGALSNTFTSDNTYWTIVENLGDNRLIRNEFNFTGFNKNGTTPVSLTVRFEWSRPDEGALDPDNDTVYLYLQNNMTGNFDQIGTLGYSPTDVTSTFTITVNASDYINTNGLVRLIVNDTIPTLGGDLASTTMSIDFMNVTYDSLTTNTTVNQIAGGGELNVHDTITNINNEVQGPIAFDISIVAIALFVIMIIIMFLYDNSMFTFATGVTGILAGITAYNTVGWMISLLLVLIGLGIAAKGATDK